MLRRQKRKAKMMAKRVMEARWFILTVLLWLYVWFGTDLLQNYY